MHWIEVDSPFGPLGLFATEKGLCRVGWNRREIKEYGKQSLPADFQAPGRAEDHLVAAREWLSLYWQGRNPGKLPPLDLSGQGEFSRQVLKQLGKVPWGEATSYGRLARAVGKPSAARAVGQAVGRNPLCPIVPCQRVLASDGSLGGFAGGPAAKRRLLRLEGFPVPRR